MAAAPAIRDPLPGLDRVEALGDQRLEGFRRQKRLAAFQSGGMGQRRHAARPMDQLNGFADRIRPRFGRRHS